MESPTIVQDAPELQRVEDLWFEDGTLVLRAESSIFRIYKSILSIKSSVLRGILSKSQKQEDSSLIEDCPVVLLDDSAEDLTYFLKAIYNADFFEKATETELPVLAGVLRLSTKYSVKNLRQVALAHLTSIYPTTLDAWEKRDSARTITGDEPPPLVVLQLARDANVPGILTAAMYCVTTCSVEDIFDGVAWNGTHTTLSDADRRTCLLARQTLITAKRRSIAAFLRAGNDVTACITPNACNTGRLQAVFTNKDGVEGCDPLWDGFDWDEYTSNVCSACLAASRASYKGARTALWADLPSIFNLPAWIKLKVSIR